MRKPLVAGNWKMHGSRVDNASLVRDLLDALRPEWAADVLLCPPYVYLWETGRLIKDSDVTLGAQNVCAETQGAFTGEVSAAMLRDVGCRYVLVGHSERRQIYGESDALVARKFVVAQSGGLVPVWLAMVVVFMGARYVILTRRASGDAWLVTGALVSRA